MLFKSGEKKYEHKKVHFESHDKQSKGSLNRLTW
jgi:hypothetical protein